MVYKLYLKCNKKANMLTLNAALKSKLKIKLNQHSVYQ